MEEKTTMQLFEDMTKKLIVQVVKESDLKAISPEMVKEIRECVRMLTKQPKGIERLNQEIPEDLADYLFEAWRQYVGGGLRTSNN